MQLPDTAVRTAIYGLLTFSGIQAFDSEATADAKPPYVLLQNQESIDFNTKSGYGWIHSIKINAVAVGPSGTGKEEAEGLLNQALSVLTTEKPWQPLKIVLGHPFWCWKIKVGQPKDLTFTGSTESVYQKFVTLELTIELLP